MILSVSRRTDIPAFFSDWFFARLQEGFACVRNPMNPRQVSRLDLSPEVVDCIVFWSKDPAPMLPRLNELAPYAYYFQYTLNHYDREIEPCLPPLEARLETFLRLSEALGKERVVWRYDPILFSKTDTPDVHLKRFETIAGKLRGAAETCVISLVDVYPSKNAGALSRLGTYTPNAGELDRFFEALAAIARQNGFSVATCAEAVSLEQFGIRHNSCIDRALIERIVGAPLRVKPDGQRPNCLCVKCEDIGAYDTCPRGCVYCYANRRAQAAPVKRCDPASPLLCGQLDPLDKVTLRPARSFRQSADSPDQLTLF